MVTSAESRQSRLEGAYEQASERLRDLRGDVQDARNRIDVVYIRIDSLDANLREEFEEKANQITKHIDDVNMRIDRLETSLRAEIDSKFDGVNQRFDGVDQRFDGVNQRFDGVNQRFDGVNMRIDRLETSLRVELDKKFDSLNIRINRLEDMVRTEVENLRRFMLILVGTVLGTVLSGIAAVMIAVLSG